MKLSLSWLKDYVQCGITPEMLSHKLTLAGLEVERVEDVSGDKVFELEITPNRPDCLSVIGLAREASAIVNRKLSFPAGKKFPITKQPADVAISSKKDCARYIGVVIENVQVTESPVWLKKRLKSIGIRPINNIVDITNFCLMEYGQPLHAFDYDKLKGKKVRVRRARKGEKIVSLDGIERTLSSDILVIADEVRPVAIAGIMGGENSEVTKNTKNILLESANFDPILIRRAGRSLGMSSDSSYRFERGVDVNLVKTGAQRAAGLILRIAGGQIAQYKDAYPGKQSKARPTVQVSIDQINGLLGAKIPTAKCKSILEKLGFKVGAGKKGSLKVTVPTFRVDIHQAVDVIEEIARIIGYDNLPETTPNIQASNVEPDKHIKIKNQIRTVLNGQGFDEVITYSMSNNAEFSRTGLQGLRGINIQNPLTQDQEMMRPDLLPSMLSVVLLNLSRGQKDLKLFEMGKIYDYTGERDVLGLVALGREGLDWRNGAVSEVDYYDVKGAVEQVLLLTGASDVKFQPLENAADGNTVQMTYQGKVFGVLGRFENEILKNWGIKVKNVYYAELSLDWVYNHKKEIRQYSPIPEYPSIIRDISLAVSQDITFRAVKDVISRHKSPHLNSVQFVEQYKGDKLPNGHRGVTVSLTYRSTKRTLTDEEVNSSHEIICNALKQELKAVQR